MKVDLSRSLAATFVLLAASSASFAIQPQLSAPHAGAVPAGPEGSVLYDQNNNPGATSITSQNFEAANDAFDTAAADDFVVPGGFVWDVDNVDVVGLYFNGPGPVASVDVNFYADAAGLPGALECARPGVIPIDTAGSFDITFAACSLAAGTHWVSVIANMDFTPGGQWGWSERAVQSFSPSAWQNPGGGFASCTTWSPRVATCLVGTDPDLLFTISGVASGIPSTLEIPTLGVWGLAALAMLLLVASLWYLRRQRTV